MEDTTTKSTVTKDETQVSRDTLPHPPSYGWQPGLLYNQNFGLPPLLDFRDLSWMEGVFRKLRCSSWPGYTQTPGFTPQPSPKIHREVGGGVSEVSTQERKWALSLDVNHFAPSEITVRTQGGFLEVEGKHDERQDEHGYISRRFLRKYKLPAGIEAENIHSFITGDGVLSIEATLPQIAPTADVTIPVQVKIEPPVLEDQKQDGRHPGEAAIADVVVPPPPEKKPEGDTVGTEERSHDTNDLPKAPESGEAGEKATTTQHNGEKKEEASSGATEEVLDTKPEVPDTVTSQQEAEIQGKEEDEKIHEEKVDGDLPGAEAAGEPSVSEKTKEEIPSKLDIRDRQAVEQMEQTK